MNWPISPSEPSDESRAALETAQHASTAQTGDPGSTSGWNERLNDVTEFRFDDEPIRPYRQTPAGPVLSDAAARGLAAAGATAIVLIMAFAAIGLHLSQPPTEGHADTAGETSPAVPARVPRQESPLRDTAVNPFLKADLDYSQTFSGFSTRPQDLCGRLEASGFPITAWQPSRWDPLTFECSSPADQGPDDPGASRETGGMFFVIRGTSDDRVTSLRVKLRLGEGDEAAAERLQHFLEVLGGFGDLAVPPRVADAIAQRRPALMSTLSGSYRFEPEKEDPDNFNLMISYSSSRVGVLTTSTEALGDMGPPASR